MADIPGRESCVSAALVLYLENRGHGSRHQAAELQGELSLFAWAGGRQRRRPFFIMSLQSNTGRIFALLNVNELRVFTKHDSLTSLRIRLGIGGGPRRDGALVGEVVYGKAAHRSICSRGHSWFAGG